MTFRFVHTADIHLDSPLKSLALRSTEIRDLIGNATRRAFVNTIDLCLSEDVDALFIAGDLYDGNQTSMKTARFLAEQFRRLDQAGIQIFAIRGNHDALSKITKELTFPENVKVFGARAEAISLNLAEQTTPVIVHGLSFAQSHASDNLLGRYKPYVANAINIGLLHTSLGGAPGHDNYAPCSISELQSTGFDYWALGHVHKRSVSMGPCTIVMPGIPQGRDINESGPKSVSLVTIADDRSIQVEERFTSVAQFERIEIGLVGIGDWRQMVFGVKKELEAARALTRSDHLVARLSFTGDTPLAWQLRRDMDLVKAEAEDKASIIGRTWIEKVEIHCTTPGQGTFSKADPLEELRSLADNEVIKSESYKAAIAEIVEELRAQLPPECRGVFGTDQEQFSIKLGQLAVDGVEDVLANLQPHTRDEVE